MYLRAKFSERVLVASASTTATLDLVERRGWVRRMPNPDDRRSTLVQITPAGRAITDRLLPGVRVVERSAMDAVTKTERMQFLALLEDRWDDLPYPVGHSSLEHEAAAGGPCTCSIAFGRSGRR